MFEKSNTNYVGQIIAEKDSEVIEQIIKKSKNKNFNTLSMEVLEDAFSQGNISLILDEDKTWRQGYGTKEKPLELKFPIYCKDPNYAEPIDVTEATFYSHLLWELVKYRGYVDSIYLVEGNEIFGKILNNLNEYAKVLPPIPPEHEKAFDRMVKMVQPNSYALRLKTTLLFYILAAGLYVTVK